MKLSEIKSILENLDEIAFQLPDGKFVPRHFHVTEIGKITKTFIDCGGTIRTEEAVNFQFWNADDYDHRLHPEKLMHIIGLSEKKLTLDDLVIEVEYQGQTVEKFGLDFDGTHFIMTAKQTDCLAKDHCGVPAEKPKAKLSGLQSSSRCSPESACC